MTTAIVACAAFLVSIFSSTVHRKLVDRKAMDATRGRVETHQKAYLAAQKEGDEKKMKRLEEEQKIILDDMKKNMMASLKPSLVTMPVILLLIWVMGAQFGDLGPIMELPIGLPFLTHALPEAGILNGMDWFGLYIVVAITSSMLMEFIVFRKILKM